MRILILSSLMLVFLCTSTPLSAQQEEPPQSFPTLTEELERLKTLKKAEFEKLKAVVSSDTGYEKKLDALRNIAALATPEAVELLSMLYDSPIDEKNENERLLIVELLKGIGSPACTSTLLKAIRHPGEDGRVRQAAARALMGAMGEQALPHLGKLTEDPVEAVRNQAWLELLKARDMKAMRHVFAMLEGDKELAALEMIKEAHFTEAAEDVAKIAKETDFSKGPNEKILKLKALETALDLGHKDSAEVAIELVGAIAKEQADVLDVILPESLIGKYTLKNIKNRKEWEEWWKKEGDGIPLFSGYVNATELKGMGAAVVEYYRGEKYEPISKTGVIYFEDSTFARALASPDNSIRKYSACELSLLGAGYFEKPHIRSNGQEARVIFFRVQGTESGHTFWLKKVQGKWTFQGIGGHR